MFSHQQIKAAEIAIQNGYLDEAKDFFTKLLVESSDPVHERIAQNRLEEINKKLIMVKEFFQFDIEYIKEENNFILCIIKCIFKEPHLKKLIEDLFANSHKKNYPSSSNIEIKQSAAQQITVELSGIGFDSRCECCKLFRKNIIYYAGSKNIYRHGYCPLGFNDFK